VCLGFRKNAASSLSRNRLEIIVLFLRIGLIGPDSDKGSLTPPPLVRDLIAWSSQASRTDFSLQTLVYDKLKTSNREMVV